MALYRDFFSANGTWTKRTNATWVRVIAIGGGGGGGGGTTTGAPGNGGWPGAGGGGSGGAGTSTGGAGGVGARGEVIVVTYT